MFGKKKVEETPSYEDMKMKELNKSMGNLIREMEKIIRAIEMYDGCANLLPDGADKSIELKDADTCRWKLRNLLSAYDADYRAWKAIDKTKLVVCSQYAEPRKSHDALHLAWMMARK